MQMGYGKQFSVGLFDWKNDQNFTLPQWFFIQFLSNNESFENANFHYLWALRFFSSNPNGNTCWVPFGFFARMEMNTPGPLPDEVWDKIADTLKLIVSNHDLPSVYQVFGINNWPQSLQGKGGSEDFLKIITVPFPLAAISTSEVLSEWVEKALSALNGNTDDLLQDSGYLLKYWGIVR